MTRSCDAAFSKCYLTLKKLLDFEAGNGRLHDKMDSLDPFSRMVFLASEYKSLVIQAEDVHNSILQPQKQILIQNLLQCLMGRILEIRNELSELKSSDFYWSADLQSAMDISSADVELTPPKYFLWERSESQKVLDQILANQEFQEDNIYDLDKPMTTDEAILLIQSHERARQGRLRAKCALELSKQDVRNDVRDKLDPPDSDVLADAAVRIQKAWRGFSSRVLTSSLRRHSMSFYNMKSPKSPLRVSGHEELDETREEQKKIWREYESSLISVKEHLAQVEGQKIIDGRKAEVMEWILKHYSDNGTFPDMPSADDDGNNFLEEVGAEGNDEEKKADEEIACENDAHNQSAEVPVRECGAKPSRFLNDLKKNLGIYEETWKNSRGRCCKPFDEDIIRADKLIEVREEFRKKADDMMRDELHRLKQAYKRDFGKKAVPSKNPAKKGPKNKKIQKRRKEKDLTPDRSLESLCEELIEQNIIRKHPEARISDFLGTRNIAPEFFPGNDESSLLPSLADVRQFVTECCILPLGSQIVHEKSPFLKSVLLVGPKGCGKRMLVDAICTATGATLFDLSPSNISGKYPGKAGLNMLLHLVGKVSRLVQPSVVLMSQAELPFLKKQKSSKMDVKRLKKELPRLLKGITADDRILFCGISNEPFDCDLRALCSCYQKIIPVPRPNYSSRYVIWRDSIVKNGGIIPELSSSISEFLNLSVLSRLSEGYSTSVILHVVRKVLTQGRVKRQEAAPLRTSEFVLPLTELDPVLVEAEQAFQAWMKSIMSIKHSENHDAEKDPKRDEKSFTKKKK